MGLPDFFLRFEFRAPNPHVPRVVFGGVFIQPGKFWTKLIFAPGAIGGQMFRVVQIFVILPADVGVCFGVAHNWGRCWCDSGTNPASAARISAFINSGILVKSFREFSRSVIARMFQK